MSWPKNEHEVETLFLKHFKLAGDFEVNDDLTVSIKGSVALKTRDLTRLPVRFRVVTGSFSCGNSSLTTLDGAPLQVGQLFNAEECDLSSLEHSPEAVGSFMVASGSEAQTLRGGPKTVKNDYDCSNGKLTSLHGAPQVVPGVFDARNNPLETLQGLPIKVGMLRLTYSPTLPLLHVALVDYETVHFVKVPEKLNRIFMAQEKRGRAVVPLIQNDLIDAGFIDNAKF